MNERIKQLAEQARKHFPKTDTSGEFWVFDEQKFAELIVRECAEVGLDSVEDGDDLDAIMKRVHNNILTHFGVDNTSIKVGSRVQVVSGFNVGAKGTVNYIEPSGKLWVRRDRASSDVFYHPEEVIGIDE